METVGLAGLAAILGLVGGLFATLKTYWQARQKTKIVITNKHGSSIVIDTTSGRDIDWAKIQEILKDADKEGDNDRQPSKE